ncbi:hypothetical protein DVG04_02240 [Salmonella enterica subsp. enterica serovar Ekpoui]|nr:hypothetical protein [Salmonella enterica]EBY3006050.1 hypothetical protein [Salmonella enterica subsp. enterica serovar Ekpoui]
MHLILQAASVLAFLAHPVAYLMYAPGDSLRRRLDATRMILCISHNKKTTFFSAKVHARPW